jgi:cytochrome c5
VPVRIWFPHRGEFILHRVSVAHDRQFRDQFSLVIGILAGAVAGILFIAIYTANRGTQADRILDEKEYQRRVAERIAPPARIAIAGQDNTALAIAPSTSAGQSATTLKMPTSGTEVYEQVCVACHGQGVGGAPRAEDAVAWNARAAKGKSVLYKHAIEGFQGEAGVMPPKGGRTDISDELIEAAVDHMIDAVPPTATR